MTSPLESLERREAYVEGVWEGVGVRGEGLVGGIGVGGWQGRVGSKGCVYLNVYVTS